MRRRIRFLVGMLAVVGFITALTGAALAARRSHDRIRGAAARERSFLRYVRRHSGPRARIATFEPANTHTPDDGDLADSQAQWSFERTAPGSQISGGALIAAAQQAQTLPVKGAGWQAVTTVPYNANPSNYTDPFWSNIGSGFGITGGRTTSLVQTSSGTWFAGTADGGVWRSTDQGGTWTPLTDALPSLAIGAIAIDPADNSLWVATGEGNVAVDNYAGTGVYRSTDGGASFQPVGDTSMLTGRSAFKLVFDPAGDAYVATTNGLFRWDAGARQWSEVLDPVGAVDNPPYDQQVTAVQVVPGSGGQDVIAAIGWHGPGNTANNGFYQSTDGGLHFSQVTPAGDVVAGDIGRTTFQYSADGTKLYAIVQSLQQIAAGDESVLQGIYVSSGSPASVAGPWTKIADERKLAASGSALSVGSGYGVGVQAWYNQDLAVDPSDPNHVYAGLEEVFESTDAGAHWVTASPYWNYGLTCPGGCPNVTHPDQHAMMVADGKIVIGNDGGVYSRPLSDTQMYGDWSDLNNTLQDLQYYDARAGTLSGNQYGVAGGLQDNGSSFLISGSPQMVEPAGGDGFYVVVDPGNANRWVGEYTDGTMYSTTNGGHAFNPAVSPTCVAQATIGLTPMSTCDPGARFGTPLVQDQQNPNVWVTGGRYVWITHAGWKTQCTSDTACSWSNVFNTGSGNAVTALSSANGGRTVYAAWVHGGNPSASFASGIATNDGGTWHQVNMAGLPNRFIAGVTVDPNNPAHAYAVFNGYSRRWIPSGGVGHVFETTNGGAGWTDISGNLPDIASDALVMSGNQLALGTDQGAFVATAGQGSSTSWSRLGTGLPNASVNDLTSGPGGYVYAATHGRGIWRIQLGR